MKESTGEGVVINPWGKVLTAGGAKVGKTCFEIGSALGVLPWCKTGGLVDDPSNLHVIAIDPGALDGVQRFLTETCKAPKEALAFKAYLLEEDAAKVARSKDAYDATLYNTVQSTIQLIGTRCAKGTPTVIVSSVTVLAQMLKRGISGPPSTKSGATSGVGMDQNKNALLNFQLSQIRLDLGALPAHVIWEAHTALTGIEDNQVETLQLPGAQRNEFPANVPYTFRVQRDLRSKAPGTNCDMTYLYTRPDSLSVLQGRNSTEALAPKEPDMALAFNKLGLRVGGWGAK